MVKTILRRLLQMIPVLFVVVTLTFILTRMIPGNPATAVLGPQATTEDIAKMEEKMGLNKSKIEQYGMYWNDILHGDFGTSYAYGTSVLELLGQRIPNTLVLSLTSLVLALLSGIPIGVYSAVHQNTAFDYIFMFLALLGISVPIFWFALMMVLVFAVNLGWFPTMGIGDWSNGFWGYVQYMVLPVICLTLHPMATFARISRSSTLETINTDYIKAMRSKGLSEPKLLWKHAFKNALPPIITVVGMQLAYCITGAMLTETIFSWPGMGMLIVKAVTNRDYALIQGTVVIVALVFIVVNLLVDLAYMLVNPKVSYEGGGKN